MRAGVVTLCVGALLGMAIALPVGAGADTLGYCDPASTQYDPVDVPAGGSSPVVVPGVRQSDVVLAGIRTRVLETGDSADQTAVIFLSPGGGADWAELMPLV